MTTEVKRGAVPVSCIAWLDALRKADNAIDGVLRCDQSMNAHELSLTLIEAQKELRETCFAARSASNETKMSDSGRGGASPEQKAN